MCESLAEQIAAIHASISRTGLRAPTGGDRLDRELGRWAREMDRVKRGPLPALERLLHALQDSKPQSCPTVTLVHGDAKPEQFRLLRRRGQRRVRLGDDHRRRSADRGIGWLELLWMQPVGITSHPAALSIDSLLAHYESASGIRLQNRSWYRALNAYKMAVICLIGAMLVDGGRGDDQKLVLAACGASLLRQRRPHRTRHRRATRRRFGAAP